MGISRVRPSFLVHNVSWVYFAEDFISSPDSILSSGQSSVYPLLVPRMVLVYYLKGKEINEFLLRFK